MESKELKRYELSKKLDAFLKDNEVFSEDFVYAGFHAHEVILDFISSLTPQDDEGFDEKWAKQVGDEYADKIYRFRLECWEQTSSLIQKALKLQFDQLRKGPR